jgi:hypothetical protein
MVVFTRGKMAPLFYGAMELKQMRRSEQSLDLPQIIEENLL